MLKKVIMVNPVNAGRTKFRTFRPPFGLLIIASIFSDKGVEVKWLDADVLRDDSKVMAGIRENLDADLLATGGLHTAYGYIKGLFRDLEAEHIQIPTIIGGRIASTLDYLIWAKIPNIDMLCRQEGEYVAESLCDNFPDIENIRGIDYKKNGVVVSSPLMPTIDSLDELPPIRWDLLDRQVYFGFNVGWVQSSIGCPYACHFCRHPDTVSKRYRVMSIPRLIEEIRKLKAQYGFRGLVVEDEHFLLRKDRVEEFCDGIKGMKLIWRCPSRADGVTSADLGLLKKMKKAGCYAVAMGMESGCQEMLDNMNKHLKLEVAEEGIRAIRAAGLKVIASFIFGYPGETRETALESAKWRVKMGLRGRYFYATPYPGTKLYDDFKGSRQMTLDDEEKYIIGSPSIKKLALNLTDMSMGELRLLDEECRRVVAVPRPQRQFNRLVGWLGRLKEQVIAGEN